MRLARILVDPDRDETAANAGVLLVCPDGVLFRHAAGAIHDLSEHFLPPSLIDDELAAIADQAWPYELSGTPAYTIVSTFEAFVSPDPRLILVDVINYPMYRSTARVSLRRRLESCPWPSLPGYPPRRATRLRQLWQTAVVALERRARAAEVVRAERTDTLVSYSYSSTAGASSLDVHLEAGDPNRPHLRLESEWVELDGRERGPTIRYQAEWQYKDQIVLKTDADVPLERLDEMGAALMDWWLEKLPGRTTA